jgi:hypothetical protein
LSQTADSLGVAYLLVQVAERRGGSILAEASEYRPDVAYTTMISSGTHTSDVYRACAGVYATSSWRCTDGAQFNTVGKVIADEELFLLAKELE